MFANKCFLILFSMSILSIPMVSGQYGVYPGMIGGYGGLGGYGTGYGMYGGIGYGMGSYGGLGMYNPYSNYWCNNYGLFGKKKR